MTLSAWKFHKDKEVAMVFSRMNLSHQAAHAGLIGAHNNKEVFSVKTRFFILVDDLDVGQPLTIRADLVLAFNDQYAIVLKRAMSFSPGLEIKVRNRGVPLGEGGRFVPIAVVSAKRRVCAAAGLIDGLAPG